jgi:mRNA-degrading endonuclease YafQ of YafQ-DinJ toxin-antitoxin module
MLLRTLDLTFDFFASFIRFSGADQKRFLKAMRLLDQDEKHPSLRVHELGGGLEGRWSVSASDDLRIEFVRTQGGRKLLIRCSRHYQ